MNCEGTFLEEFYQINGVTIGERTKNLHLLLNKYSEKIGCSRFLDSIILELKPKTYLEHVFYVKVLIYFRAFDLLLKILVNGDEIWMKKLWRETWFFEKLLEEINSKEFVNDLLPKLSFVTRLKLFTTLAKNGKNETKINDIFDEVLTKYGLDNAKNLLPGCSTKKIIEEYRKRNISLSDNEVYLIYKNRIDSVNEIALTIPYIFHSDKLNVLLAFKDIELFFKIHLDTFKYRSLKFGKKLTRKFVKLKKDEMLENPLNISKALHKKSCVKALGKDLEKFLLKMSLFHHKSTYLNDWLCFYPKSRRYVLIKNILNAKYHKNLVDAPDLINEDLLANIPSVERKQYIDMKNDDPMYIKFYETEISIPLLQKKIDLASMIFARGNLVMLLVETCKINNDEAALLEVLKYFCSRFRNDDSSVKNSFMISLLDNFDVTTFNENYWTYIDEILYFSSIKNKFVYPLTSFYLKRIEYLFKNQNLQDDDILKYMKSAKGINNPWNVPQKNPDLELHLLLKFIEKIPEILKNNENIESHDLQLFRIVLNWNKKHEDRVISILDNPRITQSLRTYLNDEKLYKIIDLYKYFFESKAENVFISEFKIKFWEELESHADVDLVVYFLAKRPLDLTENLDKFIQVITTNWKLCVPHIWHRIKCYSHLELPQCFKKHLLKEFELNLPEFSINQVISLTFVLELKEFIDLFRGYVPVVERMAIDEDEQEAHMNYRITTAVSQSLKYTRSVKAIPFLLNFCKGDYLATSLESLYYLFYHSPENKLSSFFDEIYSRAVSVRKHALKLSSRISDISTICNLMKKATQDEKNISVRQHLFLSTLSYFKKNPQEVLFELIKAQVTVEFLIENFYLLFHVNTIPKEFRLSYFIFMFELIEENLEKYSSLEEKKFDFLKNVTYEILQQLPLNVVTSIIQKNLIDVEISENSKFIFEKVGFLISLLEHNPHKIEIIGLTFVFFEKLKPFIESANVFQEFFAREIYWYYIKILFNRLHLNDIVSNDILRTINLQWNDLFTPVQFFREYLSLTLLCCDFNTNEISTYSNMILSFTSEIFSKFTLNVLDLVTDVVLHSIRIFCDKKKCASLLVYKSLIETDSSVNSSLLVIELLLLDSPSQEDIFVSIYKRLRELPDDIIQIRLNNLNKLDVH